MGCHIESAESVESDIGVTALAVSTAGSIADPVDWSYPPSMSPKPELNTVKLRSIEIPHQATAGLGFGSSEVSRESGNAF